MLPVVQSLLRDDELEHVRLTFDEPEGSWPFPAEAGSVWLTVVAVGEDFHHMLVLPTADRERAEQDDPHDVDDDAYGPLDDDADGMADNLYSQLWDWIVETGFSWGEPRDGDYVIPPPKQATGG